MQPAPTSTKKPDPNRLILLAGAAFLAAGVGLSLFTTAGPANNDSTRSEITIVLEKQLDAYRSHDLGLYMSTIDPDRLFLRDCEQQRFAVAQRLGLSLPEVVLGRTEKYGDYIRVWVRDADGWRRMFMRNDGARWYISEPTSGELGEDQETVFAGVRVSYKAVERDLVDAIGRDVSSVVKAVTAHAPAPPNQLFSVKIATMASTNGRCFVAGEAEGYGTATLTLREVRLTDEYDRVSAETEATLEHEALHWVQIDHAPSAMGSADWWLIEGWPYLIANTPSPGLRAHAVCTSSLPTYSQLRFGPLPDLQPEVIERYYVVASLLVESLSAQRADGYWKVFDGFANDSDPAVAFSSAIGLDGPSFYLTWAAAARAKYC
jgi:hypothetical protein